jgi:hypothetical protein
MTLLGVTITIVAFFDYIQVSVIYDVVSDCHRLMIRTQPTLRVLTRTLHLPVLILGA